MRNCVNVLNLKAGVPDHPPDPETQNSPEDLHPERAKRKRFIEVALNSFDRNENFGLVKTKLQQRFGLLPATAAVVAELAFAVLPR
jgi:hypothetical protein